MHESISRSTCRTDAFRRVFSESDSELSEAGVILWPLKRSESAIEKKISTCKYFQSLKDGGKVEFREYKKEEEWPLYNKQTCIEHAQTACHASHAYSRNKVTHPHTKRRVLRYFARLRSAPRHNYNYRPYSRSRLVRSGDSVLLSNAENLRSY